MHRQAIHRATGLAPVALSLSALAIALISVATGWERGLADEGAAAHLFQLLIVVQLPVVAVFLATAERGRPGRLLAVLAAQVAAVGLALAAVAVFRL